jgi:hypothetical protein
MNRTIYTLIASIAAGAAGCGGGQPQARLGTSTASAQDAKLAEDSDVASTDATASLSPDAADCLAEDSELERPYCCAGKSLGFPHIQEAFCRLYCDEDGIYCIDAQGDPLDDEAPRSLVTDQQLVVRVVAHPTQLSGTTAVITGSDSDSESRRRFELAPDKPAGAGGNGAGGLSGAGGASGEAAAGKAGAAGAGGALAGAGGAAGAGGVAVAGAATAASGAGKSGAAGAGVMAATKAPLDAAAMLCEGTCEEYRALSYTLRAISGATQVSVRLLVTKNDNGSFVTQRRLEFNVDRGKFYYELGFMLPVTFDGQRKATLAPVPGTTLQTLQAHSDPSWAFGIGLIVYPFGVYKNVSIDPRRYVRYVAPLGIGLGTNLYSPHDAFSEAYLTLNYRFASGAILGVGVTAIQGDYFKDNYAGGDLLPADKTLDDVIDDRYHFRPNLTLTLSPDVLRGFIDLISRVNSSPTPDSSNKSGPH